jgi:hypothetical protein
VIQNDAESKKSRATESDTEDIDIFNIFMRKIKKFPVPDIFVAASYNEISPVVFFCGQRIFIVSCNNKTVVTFNGLLIDSGEAQQAFAAASPAQQALLNSLVF